MTDGNSGGTNGVNQSSSSTSTALEFQMDVNKFKKHCGELRTIMQNIWAKKLASQPYSTTGTFMHLKGLKELNRITQSRIKAIRDKTQEDKLQIDQDYLRLQNLQYETLHLKTEIDNCLSFKTASDDLSLISESEFFTEAPPEFTDPASTNNPHLKMIARLAWEMERRKEYDKMVTQLKMKCHDEKDKILAKRMRLDEMHPHLSKVVEVTQPTKDILGFDYYAQREEENLSRWLPAPLYILFSQVHAYAQVKGCDISASIHGDIDKAKQFKVPQVASPSSSLLRDETQDSPIHENGDKPANTGGAGNGTEDSLPKEKKRKHHRNTLNGDVHGKKYDNSLLVFPLSVQVKMEVEGCTMQVEFSYYPQLGIITVSPKVTLVPELKDTMTDVTGVLMSEDHILDNLYPGDAGAQFPFVSTMHTYEGLVANSVTLRAGTQLSVQAFNEYYGCPYRWAQTLAGLGGLSMEMNEHSAATLKKKDSREEFPLSKPQPNLAFGLVEDACLRLKKRLSHRMRLFKELRSIERGHAASEEELRNMKPAEMEGKKCLVKLSTYETMLLHPSSREVVELQLLNEHGIFYTFEVLFSQSVVACMEMFIPMEYPERLPLAFVSTRTRGGGGLRETGLVDMQLLNIERHINLEECPGTQHVEFMYISFLVAMMAYVTAKTTTGAESSVKDSTPALIRDRKYPDRAMALKYSKKLNMFVHQ